MRVDLEEILTSTRQRVQRLPSAEFMLERAKKTYDKRDFARAISGDGISLIAEIKRKSPSAGEIRPELDAAALARTYEVAGAAAISVLTEPDYFAGSHEDLDTARSATKLPSLRKDFILDSKQIIESSLIRADAILLITSVLEAGDFSSLYSLAGELGMSVLVEVHDERDLEVALTVEPKIIGINQRNLRTMEVDYAQALRLRPSIPEGTVLVAESGVSGRKDVQALEDAGFDAILVGESLLRSPDPGAKVAELLGKKSAKK